MDPKFLVLWYILLFVEIIRKSHRLSLSISTRCRHNLVYFDYHYMSDTYSGLSSLGVPGVPWQTQYFADQLTLFQPGGTDYAHLITTGIPRFSDLPTAPCRYLFIFSSFFSVSAPTASYTEPCTPYCPGVSGFPNLELKSDPSPKNIMSPRLNLVHLK